MSKKSSVRGSYSTRTTKLTTLRSKHSQSALEYMMTYGWAILIIVIVAAGLYSLGIFNPSSSAGTTITGFSGLGTPQSLCMQDGGLRLQLGNSQGYTINITRINITSNGITNSITPNQLISPQGTYIFYIPNVCGTSSGSRYSFTSAITYTEPGTTFQGPYSSTGTAAGTVSSTINPGFALSVNEFTHPMWGWQGSGHYWYAAGGLSYMGAQTSLDGVDVNYTLTMWILANFTAGSVLGALPPNSSTLSVDSSFGIFGFSSQDTVSPYVSSMFLHRCNAADTYLGNKNVTVQNLLDNRWHFIAVAVHAPTTSSGIFDSNYYAQLDNGYAIANNSNSWSATSPIRIGTSTNQCDTGFFKGYISNVQLYGQTLSAAQVYQIYREGILGSPLASSGLVSWWPLNGTIGRWVKDYSGNGFNGTLSNATITSDFPVAQIGG